MNLSLQNIKAFAATLCSYLISPFLAFISAILATRVLGPVGRGELAAIQALPFFLAIFVNCGMGQAITYFTARQKNEAGVVLGTALTLGITLSILTCPLGALLQAHILSDYPPEVLWTGIFFILYAPLTVLNTMPWSTLLGLQYFGSFSFLRVQPQLLYVVGICTAYLLNLTSPAFISDFYILATIGISIPWTWVYYHKLVKAPLKATLPKLKEVTPYGLASFLVFLPNALNQKVDQLFIAAWLSADQLGLYATAFSYSLVIPPFLNAVGALIIPKLATQNQECQQESIGLLIRWGSLGALILSSGLAAAASWLIPVLFGTSFSGAILAFILVFASGISAVNVLLAETLRGLGKPSIASFAELTALVVTILGLVLFLKDFGLMAAACVSLANSIVAALVYLIFIKRLFPRLFYRWVHSYLKEGSAIIKALQSFPKRIAQGIASW